MTLTNKQIIDIVVELIEVMVKSGATSKKDKNSVSFDYKNLHLNLELPSLRLTFMGEAVGETKGWPYCSMSLNGKSYDFKEKATVSQKFIDHIAKSIDELKDAMFVKMKFSPLIEEYLFKIHELHKNKPNRESYLLKKNLLTLFKEETTLHSEKRRNSNHEKIGIYQEFLNIKWKLPHSLTYVRNPYIRLEQISPQYYHAKLKYKSLSVAGWGMNPYQALQMLEKHLREELSDFGKDIHLAKSLRAIENNLLGVNLENLKKQLAI